MKTKLILLSLLLLLTLTTLTILTACTIRGGTVYLIAANTDLDDSAYNLLAREGLEYALEIYKDWTPEYKQVRSEKNYHKALQEAINDGARLIISLDPAMGEYVNNLAAENLVSRFVIIDWLPPSPEDYLKNTAYIKFQENEGSFLMGIAAAMATESGMVGFLADKNNDKSEKYLAGFKAGVAYINPEVEVLVEYIEDLSGGEIVYETSLKLISAGADALYHNTGSYGKEIAMACVENDIWFIGNEKQQSIFAPENILTGMLKRIDNIVSDISQNMIHGDFPGGAITLYKINNYGIDFEHTETLSDEMMAEIEDAKFMIATDELFISENPRASKLYTFQEGEDC